MSRHGYIEGEPSSKEEQWSLICWQGAIKSALRGKRGRAFLIELKNALDAMSEKKLIAGELVSTDGKVCALGSVYKARGLDVNEVSINDYEAIAKKLGIAESMAREIMYQNDGLFSWKQTDINKYVRLPVDDDYGIKVSFPT
jgi:hypothetical protein